jgi:hypothetical protein
MKGTDGFVCIIPAECAIIARMQELNKQRQDTGYESWRFSNIVFIR